VCRLSPTASPFTCFDDSRGRHSGDDTGALQSSALLVAAVVELLARALRGATGDRPAPSADVAAIGLNATRAKVVAGLEP
jgi:hypothetical protein